MKLTWRTLEREIIAVLRENNFTVISDAGETFIAIGPYDLPMKFSLETLAKELAKRLETVR